MKNVKFLQINTLHGHCAVLLNRDESGLAKRKIYGGAMRSRISSQCLKRHWRESNSEFQIGEIDGHTAGTRSRETVTCRIINPMLEAGITEDMAQVVGDEFQKAVYGPKGTKKTGRQPLLLGEAEIAYLASEAMKIAKASTDTEEATKAAKAWTSKSRLNMQALRKNCEVSSGLTAALFGRMVTSDEAANLDAPIHVSHAITVHEEESETDYFTVLDDLSEEDPGAGHIGESELTSGIFYGYVGVDRDLLVHNLAGDTKLAGEIVRRLVHLIATESPGAKLGATAPYSYAHTVLMEAGTAQPIKLSEAFREPCKPTMKSAEKALRKHLDALDGCYGVSNTRRAMSMAGGTFPNTENGTLLEVSDWAAKAIENGAV